MAKNNVNALSPSPEGVSMLGKKQAIAVQISQTLTPTEARLLADFRKLNDETQQSVSNIMADCATNQRLSRMQNRLPVKRIKGTNVFQIHREVGL